MEPKTAICKGLLSVFLVASFAAPAYGVASYEYAGVNYSVAGSPYNPSMSVGGTFSLADPLTPNQPLANIESQLLSLNFTDGWVTYTLAAGIDIFSVGTDAAGNIDKWIIMLELPFPSPVGIGSKAHELQSSNNSGSALDQGLELVCTFAQVGICISATTSLGQNRGAPGIWTSSTDGPGPAPATVAEPDSFLLLASGFTGLGFWRRFVRSAKV